MADPAAAAAGLAGDIGGDPGAVEAAAERMLDYAARCAAAAVGLSGIDSEEWTGPAGEAFRARLGRQPGRWWAGSDAFSAAGWALRRFASMLRDGQARAARAVELHQHANRVSAQARAEHQARLAQAAVLLGPAAAAANLARFHDPGQPLRTQAQTMLATAQADVTAAAAETAHTLTAAAHAAPHPEATLPATAGDAPRVGGVLANGPDGSAWIDHRTVVPVTAPDELGGGTLTIATMPAAAGTMIPTPGITDRQTLSEPVRPGVPGEIIWQDGSVDAAYVRQCGIDGIDCDPVMNTAIPVVEAVASPYIDAIEHPNPGTIAIAAGETVAAGAAGAAAKLVARAGQWAIKTTRDLNKADHAIADARDAAEADQAAATGAAAETGSSAGLDATKLNMSKTVEGHFGEYAKDGTLARPYTDSRLTIQNVMDAVKPTPDPGGVPGALRWDAPGTLNGSRGTWELVVDPNTNTILHFMFRGTR